MLYAALLLALPAPRASLPYDQVSHLYVSCLLDFERHAESTWHDAPAPERSGYFGDGVSGGNAGIRGTCGVMVAYATLIHATGDQLERRLERLERGLRYAALTHQTGGAVCVDGQTWGHGWQTSLWAGSMAFACALVEERLAPETVAAVRRAVADEADYRASTEPLSGFQGDSKAEENAWNSNLPAIAAAWMPDHPNAAAWAECAKRFAANSYTVPDEAGPLAPWITTQTLYPSYACENHGFFHPSYQMVTGMSLADSWVMARQVRPALAAELAPFCEHNQVPVWRCLQQVLLDSGELAYPSGLDWALHGYGQISYYAWLACHLDDPLARWAETMLAQHLAHRQRVNGDGRFTGESQANGFYREAVCARRVALAWWQHALADHSGGPRTPPRPFGAHLPDVKLVLHRGATGFVALSYGARVMLTVAPAAAGAPAAPYVTTPRYPSLLAGAARAELQSIDLDDDGFDATLELTDGLLESWRARVVSRHGAVAVLEVPVVSLFRRAGAAVFPVGIENHALTGGRRHLVWEGGRAVVPERSGTTVDVPSAWLCIDDRLGLCSATPGSWRYRAAAGYNRDGAAEDTVEFAPADPAAPRFAVALPRCGSREVARSAATAVLRSEPAGSAAAFTAPDGTPLELRLEHGPPATVTVAAVAAVEASSESPRYPAANTVDGDPETFWVSGDGDPQPGDGPTVERPERLAHRLADSPRVASVLLVPRPGYGPRRVRLILDGAEAWQGELVAGPKLVALPAPKVVDTAVVVIESSYDPRYPAAPRNTQVAEVAFVLDDVATRSRL